MSWRILNVDAREGMRALDAASVQTVVTSPPYFSLRDYGVEGQIGLEPTLGEYVEALVEVFREVRRVLRPDGTAWLNLGDSYATKPRGTDDYSACRLTNPGYQQKANRAAIRKGNGRHRGKSEGLKNKDQMLVPFEVAKALREDGWWLRSTIIWHKPSCTPESVTDRPTVTHEYIFLLSQRDRYYYDAAAIREDFADEREGRDGSALESERDRGGRQDGFTKPNGIDPSANGGRNKRSVWTVATTPWAEAHYATFPPKLIEPCIKAGSRVGDLVLDPFCGSGVTLLVAERLGRDSVGIELNPEYVELARRRILDDAPLLNWAAEAA